MSQSAATQRQAILHYLRNEGHMTTLDARNQGVMHPAMRICELRQRGHNISTGWLHQTDDAGVTHRVGVYTLDGETQ